MYTRKPVLVCLCFAVYFFIIFIVATFFFLSGLEHFQNTYDKGIGIIYICVSVVLCYIITAYFLKSAAGMVSTESAVRTFSENLRALPKLIIVYAIFAAVFAILSQILTQIVAYSVFSGNLEKASVMINICVAALTIVSLPFFMQAFAAFANGKTGFSRLLAGTFRMGGSVYGKYLLLGAFSYFLAYCIRTLTEGMPAPAGMFSTHIPTALLFGASLYLVLQIYRKEGSAR
jgi:hypothetical protein